jgi:hypothetical protein
MIWGIEIPVDGNSGIGMYGTGLESLHMVGLQMVPYSV